MTRLRTEITWADAQDKADALSDARTLRKNLSDFIVSCVLARKDPFLQRELSTRLGYSPGGPGSWTGGDDATRLAVEARKTADECDELRRQNRELEDRVESVTRERDGYLARTLALQDSLIEAQDALRRKEAVIEDRSPPLEVVASLRACLESKKGPGASFVGETQLFEEWRKTTGGEMVDFQRQLRRAVGLGMILDRGSKYALNQSVVDGRR